MNRIVRFNSIFVKSAKKHLGKVKPGKRTKAYMSPALRSKICARNQLLGNYKREAWIKACTEVNKSIRNAKQESWKEVREDFLGDEDEHKLWKLVFTSLFLSRL